MDYASFFKGFRNFNKKDWNLICDENKIKSETIFNDLGLDTQTLYLDNTNSILYNAEYQHKPKSTKAVFHWPDVKEEREIESTLQKLLKWNCKDIYITQQHAALYTAIKHSAASKDFTFFTESSLKNITSSNNRKIEYIDDFFSIDTSGDQALSTQLGNCITELLTNEEETEIVRFFYKAHNNIFLNIVFIETLKILWNLTTNEKGKEKASKLAIIGSTNFTRPNRFSDKNLIETSYQSLSLLLSGIDYIIYRNNEKLKDNLLSLSAHYILTEEAKLGDTNSFTIQSHLLNALISQLLAQASKYLAKQKLLTESTLQVNQEPNTQTDHKNYSLPGEPPFLQGPYHSMYLQRPWTIRQYAGFSTAEESNQFYKENLKKGQKGLSVAFDLPTHRGYDSDNSRVTRDVGKAGVAIDTVEDMKMLFNGIPLDKMSVSMTMNGAVLPIMAFYIATALEQGVSKKDLRGTIQNDILKEFLVRNTYIYPPQSSMNIVAHIFKYCSEHLPKFNPISISGYHMHEAGAPAHLELAYTLANGLEYIKTGINNGMNIDDFAPRLSFFWGIGMNFHLEIAKLRAARVIWANLIKRYEPKNPKSMALRTHCQTSGWSLTAQSPFNNVTRTCLEALSATLGHTQSLHTNSLDEAIALPSKSSAAIARSTQIHLQEETGICDFIDPLGGSPIIESHTKDLITKAWKIIADIEKEGGMTSAITANIPQQKIEAAATIKQALIDQGKETIVGLNSYQNHFETELNLLEVNNEAVLKAQLERLESIRATRDTDKVNNILAQIELAAQNNKQNLLSLAIDAALARATLGEISFALEKVYGRYKAKTTTLNGIYLKENETNLKFNEVLALSDKVATHFGRRPRILIAKLGQDGHDRGAKFVASSLADLGFDVDLAPLFQTPSEVVRQAIDNDVHIIGISSQAGAHLELTRELIAILKDQNAPEILVTAGGVIPENDFPKLYDMGVIAVFGPGTNIIEAAALILSKLTE